MPYFFSFKCVGTEVTQIDGLYVYVVKPNWTDGALI